MIFNEREKAGQINFLFKRYGSKENVYKALEIGMNRAKQAGDKSTVEKFSELISYFDREFGNFSI